MGKCKEFLLTFSLTLLGIFTWFSLLLLVVTCAPIYFYRFAITKMIAPLWRAFNRSSNLKEAVTVFGNGSALEFWRSRVRGLHLPTRCSVVSIMIFEGHISFKDVENDVHTRWLTAKDKNGKLLYPEFQQYIENWMGFMFWKECKEFRLADHLNVHNITSESSVMESEKFFDSLVERLLNEPYPDKKSPWEIHLIQNYTDRRFPESQLTALVIRFHHGMADGYAMTNALFENLFEGNLESISKYVVSQSSRISLMSTIARVFLFPLRLCYDIGYIFTLYFRKTSQWHVSERTKSWRQLFERTERIPLSKLKAIKNKFGVSVMAVLFSCVAYGFSKRSNVNTDDEHIDAFPCATFLPLPNRSKKLRNEFTGTILELPVSAGLDPIHRLRCCEERVNVSKNSTLPFTLKNVVSEAVLAQVAPIAKFLSKNRTIPSGISVLSINYLGKIKWNGHKLLSAAGITGANMGCAGISVLAMTYDDYIEISAAVESSVINRKELQQRMGWITEEIEKLASTTSITEGERDKNSNLK